MSADQRGEARPAAPRQAAAPLSATERVTAICTLLQAALQPHDLQVIDDSHAHAGHRSAGGKGHFRVRVVSTRFAGLTALQRHRLVNEALAPLWQSELHAVSVSASTPDELNQ
jgi:BolA protein